VTLDPSTRGRRNRARGGDAERKVVKAAKAAGFPNARRYGAGDGAQPGDVDLGDRGARLCLEVKDVASSSWPKWLRQAADEAAARDLVPVVVRRTRGLPDAAQWPAVVPSSGLVELGGVVPLTRVVRGSARPAEWVATHGRVEWLDGDGAAWAVVRLEEILRAARRSAS
jgi:hypothetical protein